MVEESQELEKKHVSGVRIDFRDLRTDGVLQRSERV